MVCTVSLGYNNTGYNNNLFVAIESYGIDYFVKKIMITFLVQLFVRFSENFDDFMRKLL